ncbi:MAG: response regulator, partial [Actinomycetota bacterium]
MSQRILVVEDDRTIALAIVERLRAEGFEAESVADGVEAIELVERRPPDLVVLDLMLPGIDGIEVCRRLQHHRTVPVIMLTARTDEADVLIGLGVGADDYITKPFNQTELVARIRATLRRVEVTRSA